MASAGFRNPWSKGELLQWWTGGQWLATPHRVLARCQWNEAVDGLGIGIYMGLQLLQLSG